MTHRNPCLALALVIAVGLGTGARPAQAAAVAARAAPTALLQADAGLAAAINAANAEAWVAFYDPRVIARLPYEGVVEGKDAAHRAVTQLLARRIGSSAWTPARWILSASGRLATVYGAYVLRFEGSQAPRRGERVEIWRERSGGGWDCIVDAWNPPLAPVEESVAPAPPPVAMAAPAPAAPSPARSAPAAPTRAVDPKYGAEPIHYAAAIRQYFAVNSSDPASVIYRRISAPARGYTTAIAGTVFMHEKRFYGWKVEATVDAKDAGGRAVRDQTYTFLFRGETIVRVVRPLPTG
jgi:ketosteroid isomerase-like protein